MQLRKSLAVRVRSARRLRVGGVHFLISAGVVAASASFVLLKLYPAPLYELEGLLAILLLVVAVDVGLGPALSFVVAAPNKSRAHLARDLAVIGCVQLAALVYAGYTIYVARPVFVVFNTDRFDIVTPSELDWRVPGEGPLALRAPPSIGPMWVQAIPPPSVAQRNKLLMDTVMGGGPDLKNLPDLFHAWPSDVAAIRGRLRPLSELRDSDPDQWDVVSSELDRQALSESDVGYVPLLGRVRTGVVLLRRSDLLVVAALAVKPNY